MPVPEWMAADSVVQDKTIVLDMLKDSKYYIIAITRVAVEASSPRLRQFAHEALAEAMQEHFRLADSLAGRGWYRSDHAGPELQVELEPDRQVSQIKIPTEDAAVARH